MYKYNTKKNALCKVWEINEPEKPWTETFSIYCIDDIDAIFAAFNSSLRPNELPRSYEFVKFVD